MNKEGFEVFRMGVIIFFFLKYVLGGYFFGVEFFMDT